ncbi:MAG: lasso peptide biosynthesis B2 protein [Pyrinomonadaceae bacterium]
MSGLRTLFRLKSSERRLVLQTLFLVAAIRTALSILGVQRVQRLTSSWQRLLLVDKEMPVSRLVWAVKAASRRIPAASCLTQSLALHCLLTRAGHASQIQIGVAKDPAAKFHAHAWVEYAGVPLLSDTAEVDGYVHMLGVEG